MPQSILIITTHAMLNIGDAVEIFIWESNVSIFHLLNCISLRYNLYGGWYNYKDTFICRISQNPRLLYLSHKK